MSLVSIRLPDDVEARLADEAERAGRPKSEIARDAIIDYLERLERERFLADIARAARERDGREVVAEAEEALPFDNEALDIVEGRGVRESRGKYQAKKGGRKSKKKR